MYELFVEHAPRCGIFPALDDFWNYVDTKSGYRLIDIWNYIKSEKARGYGERFILEHDGRVIWEDKR